MPLRIYDNNDWRSPTNIRVYDNQWRDAQVGFVYNLGVWRVVFPDPIIPSISVSSGPFGDRQSVYVNLSLVNTDYIIAELYSGSTQSTLVQTQTIEINELITDSKQVRFTGLSNNTTYNMKITAYSITENTSVYLSGPVTTINVITPTVNITSIINEDLQSATINWTSTNQYQYRVVIYRTSDSLELWKTGVLPNTGTQTTVTAYFNAVANTNYTVFIEVISTSFDGTTDTDNFTTPNIIQPQITSLSGSGDCNSITISWSASQYVSGRIGLHQITGGGGLGEELYGHSFSSQISSYTFTGLSPDQTYSAVLTLTSSTGSTVSSYESLGERFVGTLQPSVNAPTNFTASSDYWGKTASFTWTAATGTCTTVSGYRIEYKLSTSSTFSVLSDSIASNATSFSAGGIGNATFAPNRTYNFRIFAKGPSFIESATSANVDLIMNNNPYGIVITGTTSISTFSTSTLTAQIRNADAENISRSEVSIGWSFQAAAVGGATGSSVSPLSANTDSSGQATTVFSSSSTDGAGTVLASTPNLGPFEGGSRTVTVNLRTGQSAQLAGTGTTKGVSFNNNSHDSLYSYTNASGYPTVGSLESGDSYNNSQFDILMSRTRDTRPSVSKSGRTATTTNTTFLANELVSMVVTSSRLGYTTVSGPIAAMNSSIAITSRSYQWQQFTGSPQTWNTNFGGAFSDIDAQTMSWSNTTFTTRQIRCNVTTNFSNGQVDTATSTNTVTIP